MTPTEVVHRVIELFNAGELEQAIKYVAADAIDHAGLPGARPGRADWLRRWQLTREEFPDLEVIVEESVEHGEMVCNRYTMRGTHTREAMGLSPTGRRFEAMILDMIRISDGQLREHWALGDEAALREQLTGA